MRRRAEKKQRTTSKVISRERKQEKGVRIISKAIGRAVKKAFDSLKEKTIIR